jgi:hypothetical protein
VRFVPAHFPDQPLANEPAPPATNACGTLNADEQAGMTTQAAPLMSQLSAGKTEVIAKQ